MAPRAPPELPDEHGETDSGRAILCIGVEGEQNRECPGAERHGKEPDQQSPEAWTAQCCP